LANSHIALERTNLFGRRNKTTRSFKTRPFSSSIRSRANRNLARLLPTSEPTIGTRTRESTMVTQQAWGGPSPRYDGIPKYRCGCQAQRDSSNQSCLRDAAREAIRSDTRRHRNMIFWNYQHVTSGQSLSSSPHVDELVTKQATVCRQHSKRTQRLYCAQSDTMCERVSPTMYGADPIFSSHDLTGGLTWAEGLRRAGRVSRLKYCSCPSTPISCPSSDRNFYKFFLYAQSHPILPLQPDFQSHNGLPRHHRRVRRHRHQELERLHTQRRQCCRHCRMAPV
jgi:hypothetical protein